MFSNDTVRQIAELAKKENLHQENLEGSSYPG